MKTDIATPDSPAGAGSSPSPLFGLPQSPGWYWCRLISYPAAVSISRVDWSDHERCFIISDGVGTMFPIDTLPDHEWYGPLTPPQWPNGMDEGRRTQDSANTTGHL